MADHSAQVKLSILSMYSDPDYRPQNGDKFHDSRRELRGEIFNKVIVTMPFNARFTHDNVRTMLLAAMREGQAKLHVQQAFEYLEIYCLNLIHYYWKPEYSRIKRFTGVYRSKLLAVLPDVDNFISQLGYKLDKQEDIFVLSKYVSRKFIRQLALDCYIAQAQCEFLDIVTIAAHERNNNITWRAVSALTEKLEGDERDCSKRAVELSGLAEFDAAQPLSLVNYGNNSDISEDEDMYG